jgi:osmotically inducible protein OsmC
MGNVYTAIATTSGRDGRAVSSDGKLDVTLSMPVEMGGDGAGTNPEQLFAAGYAACFATSMKLVAPSQSLDVSDASVTAEVGLALRDAGGYALNVTLRVELPDHVTPQAARELLAATHQVCPYSNATRGNIPVDLVIE